MALARNDWSTEIPKVALIQRHRFGHIPAYWANPGDWVIVENAEWVMSNPNVKRTKDKGQRTMGVKFVTPEEVRAYRFKEGECTGLVPWGWDRSIAKWFSKLNPAFKELVPSDEELQAIRTLSSRTFAAKYILPELVKLSDLCVGHATECTNLNNSEFRVHAVLKSPWSCSGRGVRFIDSELSDNDRRWAEKIIRTQGCIMLEPHYAKVLDFGLEFEGDRFLGLNIFETRGAGYLGNLSATEDEKRAIIAKYIPLSLLDMVVERILQLTSIHFNGKYQGAYGVDCMIVTRSEAPDNKGDKCNIGFALHPCVELNLRRTMGHVALYN